MTVFPFLKPTRIKQAFESFTILYRCQKAIHRCIFPHFCHHLLSEIAAQVTNRLSEYHKMYTSIFSTDWVHQLVIKRNYMLRVPLDTWHLTCDMWWGVNILSKYQLPSSYGLGFTMSWRFRGKGWVSQLIMSNKGDCRTAPALLGLLTRQGSPVDSPLASPLSCEVSLKDK